MKKEIKEYFEINEIPEVHPIMIWDAFKAIIRGFLIKINAIEEKKRTEALRELYQELEETEKELKRSGKKKLRGKMKTTDTTNRKFWESTTELGSEEITTENLWGCKPRKYLAHQLKKRKERKLINKIVKDQKEIVRENENKNAFLKYYSNLYKQTPVKSDELEAYIQNCQIKQISSSDRESLNKVITKEEIQEVISSMKVGKAPGPDGFTLKFYKVFREELIPRIHTLANNILEGDLSPKTWQDATVSLIPKTDTVAPDVKDFKPISLLNTDYKIIKLSMHTSSVSFSFLLCLVCYLPRSAPLCSLILSWIL